MEYGISHAMGVTKFGLNLFNLKSYDTCCIMDRSENVLKNGGRQAPGNLRAKSLV